MFLKEQAEPLKVLSNENGKHSFFEPQWTPSREEHKRFQRLKGTVQWELRWVKIGINRSIMIYSFAGKCHLPCPKGHHHESFKNVSVALLLFDAIPTCWVRKDNSVGLICRNSDAVAAQRQSIPKCVVKTSAGIITASVLRRCNCAASMSPKMLPRES